MRKEWCIIFGLTCAIGNVSAQVKWTGLGGDGLWSNSLNWYGNTIPTANDSVLLDHSFFAAKYFVQLPDTTVTILKLRVDPGFTDSIFILIPASNTISSAAFVLTDTGYGLQIHDKGVFINQASVSGGTNLSISDSMAILDGGTYIHQTRSGHAAILNCLSKAPFTSRGNFIFKVPAASYIISFSNRTYGNLILSAVAAPAQSITYSSTGVNPVRIRGDFELQDGVNYKLDLDDTVFLSGNLFQQQGSLFNVANGSGSSVIAIAGNIHINDTITKTGPGKATLMMNGINLQNIHIIGTQINDIRWVLNNSAGAVIQNDVSIQSEIELLNGKIQLRDFQLGAKSVKGYSQDKFIICNGAGMLQLQHDSLNQIFFPVGYSDSSYNPIHVSNVSQTLSVRIDSGIQPPVSFPSFGINRTWQIFGTTLTSPLQVSFYFSASDASSGCDPMKPLEHLQFIGGVWNIIRQNLNAVYNGMFRVTTEINVINTPIAFGQSGGWVLPIRLVSFDISQNGQIKYLVWKLQRSHQPIIFHIQHSAHGWDFKTVDSVLSSSNEYKYLLPHKASGFYRLNFNNGITRIYSPVIHVDESFEFQFSMNRRNIIIKSSESINQAMLTIYNSAGMLVFYRQIKIKRGVNQYAIPTLSCGMYFTRIDNDRLKSQTFKSVLKNSM